MKKLMIIPAIATVLGLSYAANAQYTGPAAEPVTVEAAKKLADDTPVVLVGKIEKSLGGEKYTFTDETGSVTVEIDNEDWRGVSAGPNDVVEIHGEVDKDFTKFEIDVDAVKLAPAK